MGKNQQTKHAPQPQLERTAAEICFNIVSNDYDLQAPIQSRSS
jgi:hypothetical protein